MVSQKQKEIPVRVHDDRVAVQRHVKTKATMGTHKLSRSIITCYTTTVLSTQICSENLHLGRCLKTAPYL